MDAGRDNLQGLSQTDKDGFTANLLLYGGILN